MRDLRRLPGTVLGPRPASRRPWRFSARRGGAAGQGAPQAAGEHAQFDVDPPRPAVRRATWRAPGGFGARRAPRARRRGLRPQDPHRRRAASRERGLPARAPHRQRAPPQVENLLRRRARRHGTGWRSAAPRDDPPPPAATAGHADSLPRPPGTGGSPRSITTRGKPPPISTSALPSACFSRSGRAQSSRSRTTPARVAACGSKWSPRSTSAADSPLSVAPASSSSTREKRPLLRGPISSTVLPAADPAAEQPVDARKPRGERFGGPSPDSGRGPPRARSRPRRIWRTSDRGPLRVGKSCGQGSHGVEGRGTRAQGQAQEDENGKRAS